MELNDRIFVAVGNREVQCVDEHEALRTQLNLLDEEPEGTLVEVRVEFSDGDSVVVSVAADRRHRVLPTGR